MKRVLIINGALGGAAGNTAEVLALAELALSQNHIIEHLDLSRQPRLDRVLETVQRADGFVFGTGTYWDSWSSHLQRFLEETAHTEGFDYWVGKPAILFATAHAVGAKGLLSRLMGVLNVYGLWFPPMAALGITYVNQVAYPHANQHLQNELWTPADVETLCHNLGQALSGERNWQRWPNNSGRYGEKWLTCATEKLKTE
ncbi:MAG: NAD(P)H-dependent oxidoreductase [Fimbriimonadaceae bacterium]|jgi:chromate reductase|nr:NAD(P)H-dependent oxidoreductase [Fimbriimonadaceae bacterium]